MRLVFADTNYWAAKINPADQWHEAAVEAEYRLGTTQLLTTESVLIETLNFFSSYRSEIRSAAAKVVRRIIENSGVEVVPHRIDEFQHAIALYEARPDKRYSLTDCIAINVMRERGVSDILSHDDEFAQEGFTLLM